tara:strand:- start:244 stop:468 length:225 start_codon:yes stop_codon:yes gene_type:complete
MPGKKDLVCTQKQETVIINKVNIMSKNIEGKDNWSFSIGFYPGLLIGIRTYEEQNQTTHVLYLPFIDIALEIYK